MYFLKIYFKLKKKAKQRTFRTEWQLAFLWKIQIAVVYCGNGALALTLI